MSITQKDVDEIIAKAKTSEFGLGAGLTYKNGHNQIDQYAEPHGLTELGMLLVNGYHEKYDLISVFCAALQHVREKSLIAGANAQR